MSVLMGYIILKDVIYSQFSASETQVHITHKIQYLKVNFTNYTNHAYFIYKKSPKIIERQLQCNDDYIL